MFDRIEDEVRRGAKDVDDLRRRILPSLGANIGSSPQLNLLRSQYERHRAVQSLHKFGKPPQEELPPLFSSRNDQATIWRLTEPALSSGYVDYVPLSDGVVRIVPLVAGHRGRIIPQMSLALACAALDVPFEDVRLERNRIIIPRSVGEEDIHIPVRSHDTPQGRFGMFFDIPWFGGRDWETMYDYPSRQEKHQHVSLAFVGEVREFIASIERNNANIDDALSYLLYRLNRPRHEKFVQNPLPPDDVEARAAHVAWVVSEMKESGWDAVLGMRPEELDEAERRLQSSYASMIAAHRAVQESKLAIDERRADLRARLDGKVALIGYIAMSAVADQIPTSLHARCPGVVVHGVIFNSIMTGDFWRATAPWVSVVLTVVMGLLTTLIVVSLTPWKALAGATVLAGGYLLYNGLYFFDYRNLIVGVAGPVTAIGAVWAGGTFARYVLESIERARVKRRFENYVDPALVEYVLETDARLDGEKKELSVVFTDLQGFTTLAEALGEKTVGMLNEYMSLMVPVIRKHRGLLNKFLGDGIMYFFGAPKANPQHAYDAVASVLEMQEVMVEFNKGLAERNLPTLITRAGISSGEMIVGDAGSAQGSDYTVLGDVVNLGARLESANKFFGTRILMNERAHTLVKDRILTRPVGKLQVVGKKEGIITYEAMALLEKATEAQKELARLTTEMVTAFINGNFERCAKFADEIDDGHGASKLTELYRAMCEQNLVSAPVEFTGNIVLTAK
jgi:class 3 adenylate cyclase